MNSVGTNSYENPNMESVAQQTGEDSGWSLGLETPEGVSCGVFQGIQRRFQQRLRGRESMTSRLQTVNRSIQTDVYPEFEPLPKVWRLARINHRQLRRTEARNKQSWWEFSDQMREIQGDAVSPPTIDVRELQKKKDAGITMYRFIKQKTVTLKTSKSVCTDGRSSSVAATQSAVPLITFEQNTPCSKAGISFPYPKEMILPRTSRSAGPSRSSPLARSPRTSGPSISLISEKFNQSNIQEDEGYDYDFIESLDEEYKRHK